MAKIKFTTTNAHSFRLTLGLQPLFRLSQVVSRLILSFLYMFFSYYPESFSIFPIPCSLFHPCHHHLSTPSPLPFFMSHCPAKKSFVSCKPSISSGVSSTHHFSHQFILILIFHFKFSDKTTSATSSAYSIYFVDYFLCVLFTLYYFLLPTFAMKE